MVLLRFAKSSNQEVERDMNWVRGLDGKVWTTMENESICILSLFWKINALWEDELLCSEIDITKRRNEHCF